MNEDDATYISIRADNEAGCAYSIPLSRTGKLPGPTDNETESRLWRLIGVEPGWISLGELVIEKSDRV